MPKIQNKKFIPVNKTEAKNDIFKTVEHNYEFTENLMSKERSRGKTTISGAVKSQQEFQKGLSDPFFASRLDKMGKLSFNKMMYSNHSRDKESLYDYQKIQSTAQGSQFLG